MPDFYVTFGTAHNEAHPLLRVPSTRRLSEGYVTIEAPNYETARRFANVLLGATWAFMYESDDKPAPEFVPDGELFRLAWLNFDRLDGARDLINGTYQAADGDSNDSEIAALQLARDELETIVNYPEGGV